MIYVYQRPAAKVYQNCSGLYVSAICNHALLFTVELLLLFEIWINKFVVQATTVLLSFKTNLATVQILCLI